MTICKQALRIALHHPVYLAAYVVFLSLMGVILVGQDGAVPTTDTLAVGARIALVDRDGSAVSAALREHLSETDEIVPVADEPIALQDALATSQADLVLILPEGFGNRAIEAARAGGDAPRLDVAYGADMQAGALAVQRANSWVSLLMTEAALEPHAEPADMAEAVEGAAAASPEPEVVETPQADTAASRLSAYFSFSTYSLTSSIVVIAGVVFATLGAPEVRQRQLAAPVSTWRQGAQSLLGCGALSLIVLAWIALLGIVATGSSGLLAQAPVQLLLAVASIAAFALVPFSLAYTLSQCGFREEALNAIANMSGMVMSFLGGAWVPLSMFGPGMQAVAHFVPTFWAIEGAQTALTAREVTGNLLASVGLDIAIVVLFAAAIASIGLVLARLRVREA